MFAIWFVYPPSGIDMAPSVLVGYAVTESIETGKRGMLKKSKTSRYSSSFGAGVRAGVTEDKPAALSNFG